MINPKSLQQYLIQILIFIVQSCTWTFGESLFNVQGRQISIGAVQRILFYYSLGQFFLVKLYFFILYKKIVTCARQIMHLDEF